MAFDREGNTAFQGVDVSNKGSVEDRGDDLNDVYPVHDIVLWDSEADPGLSVLGGSCASCVFESSGGPDGLRDGVGFGERLVETHCDIL